MKSLPIKPSEIPFKAEISGPGGNLLSSYSPVESPFATSIATESRGDYTLTITNIGTQRATVNVGMIISEAVISGLIILELTLVLVIAGMGLLIFGGIGLVRQRKQPPH